MLSRKYWVGTVFSLLLILICSFSSAAAQSVSLGPGLGNLTYTGGWTQYQCWITWSEYYDVPYNYSVANYSNFKYVPDPSTKLATVSIGGALTYIEGSMGPGLGTSDGCPSNSPLSGQTITYSDHSSKDGGLAGYAITINDALGNLSAGFSLSGYIDPKWEVVGILYAPPGAQYSGGNNVDYATSTLVSVTNTIDKTFSSGKTVTTSFSEKTGGSIPGVWEGSLTFTQGTSNSWTQGTEDKTSTTVSKTTNLGLTVKPGPSGYAGLDHDWDLLEVWVNPVTLVTVGNNGASSWSGYGFASGDNRAYGDMEIAKVNLGCLNGNWSVSSFPTGLGPPDLAQLLQQYCGSQTYGYRDVSGNWNNGPFLRAWAAPETFDSPDTPPANQPPGYSNASLSPADFQTIGRMDPWYNCTNVSSQPSSGQDWTTDGNGNWICPSPNPSDTGEPNILKLEAEFTPISTNGPVPYAQGQNFAGSIGYQNMNSQSTTKGTTSTRSFGWETGMEWSTKGGPWIFSGGFKASVTVEGKYTTTIQSNKEITTQTTSTVSATLGPPPGQGVDGCPANVPYPPGGAYTNYPEQQPDCGVPIPGVGPAYGQKTSFNVYEDNYFGSFMFSPVYY